MAAEAPDIPLVEDSNNPAQAPNNSSPAVHSSNPGEQAHNDFGPGCGRRRAQPRVDRCQHDDQRPVRVR